ASATCGEEAPARGTPRPTEDLYCKLVGGPVAGGDPNQTIQGQYCDICTAANSNRAHPVSNAIDGTERWWQSPPLSRGLEYNEVNVTLDLGQVFHVAYVLIKFANAPRPDLWVLERSTDFGLTYQPWQFFASSKRDCLERFGAPSLERITRDDDVICTTEYSRIVPLENGEVVVSLVNRRPGAMNFSYSPLLRDFTKATNIRLRFLRTNTLLGHLMGKALRDPTVTRRYYYSIKDISIGGRCVCHGHADVCDAKDPTDPFRSVSSRNSTGEQVLPAGQISVSQKQVLPRRMGVGHCSLSSPAGTLPEGCDEAGRCPCRPGFDGPHCDRCRPGHHGYPDCRACGCDPRGALDEVCGAGGLCRCRPGYTGATCQECSPGHHGFPACAPCHCSADGSLHTACDPRSGQCSCRPRVTGLRCDSCVPGTYNFPDCEAGSCHPAGLAPADHDLPEAQVPCACRAHVEGPSCDRCKPGFWGLSPSNPKGCTRCSCDPRGTLGGVAQCQPSDGHCFCKAHVCGRTCAACKDGFFGLDQANYFGCHSCQCDVGGALGQGCEPRTGACRCRPNTQGPTCSEPAPDHFLPDLHHVRLELEEAATPDGRPVRFGFNPLEFENFSWRGYAQMAPIQPRIVARLDVTSPDLFRLVFRYVNRGPTSVSGRVSVREEGKFATCTNCTEQSQPVVFPPSTEPAFVTVPQRGFGEPFVLNPGTWALLVEAEGVLLDYVALLPSVYYEAALLQLRVTEACTFRPTAQRSGENCLLYTHLPLDGFPSAPGPKALCRHDNSLPRPCPTEQLSPSHPPLAACQGSDMDVQLRVAVPQPGRYALVVEYANEDTRQELGVTMHTPQRAPQQGALTLHPCLYSMLCRGTALDAQQHLAVFHLDTEASVQLTAERAHFFLHSVTLVPVETFTPEFVEPRVHCVSSHGTFSPSRAACLPSRFPKPPQPIVLRDCQVLPLPPSLPLTHSPELVPGAAPAGPQPRPPTAVDPDAEPTLLRHPQGTVVFTTHVPALGRYAVLLHGFQPAHPTFVVEVLVNGGRIWQGHANASFCPHGYGCRALVLCEGQALLDVTDSELTVTVRVPEGRWPCGRGLAQSPRRFQGLDDSGRLTPRHRSCWGRPVPGLTPQGCSLGPPSRDEGPPALCPLPAACDCSGRLCDELSGQCICPPRTVRPHCTVCQPQTFGCHPLVGCEECSCSGPGIRELADPSCDTDSGQCKCRPNVAGRRCDTCAPGFHGYPSCHPCDCHQAGSAPGVCDPVTGQCYCKENVQGPRCDQCRLGTFSLDAANPKGCTRCFCFGATERCRSSTHTRQELVDMQGWTLLSGDRQVVPHELRAEAELLHADLRHAPDALTELYWQAPPSYLGDRVSSYGGTLHYELHSESQRGDVFVPTESRPDVVLQGNQMSIMFLEPVYPTPGHVHRRQLQLVEGNFRHAETHSAVSREELMMVLASLEQLHIRALFSKMSSAVSLRRVALEVASEAGGGPPASNVELCMCPANYLGDSCQDCAPGYYRDIKGPFLGRCVPCQCHGHSDRCLPGSGVCVGCQHSTEGDHCEHCQAGFVRSGSEDPAAPCVSCPCPLAVPSNNFAVGCVSRGGRTQCLCKPGYAGTSCERCAPGFFGNPLVLGSSCQPCDCSGNGDPNLLFKDCDPLTGACRGCLRHTAGPRCETCAPGFYGDALLPGNCSRCDCSPCGTETCDPRSGRCLCKAGVTGPRCDRCQDGHFGFEGCGGCRPCACGPAAEGSECHPQSGQCHCRPGTAGLQCRECAPGHWGLPEQGCRRCQCQGGPCDLHTGRCTCPPGLSGERCDTCSQQHQVPVPGRPGGPGVHCEVCDHCVVVLLDDLERAGALLPAIRDQLRTVSSSAAAWAGLHRLNASIADLKGQLRGPPGPPHEPEQQLGMLERQSASLGQDVQRLDGQATGARAQAGRLVDSTEATLGRAQTLLVAIRAVEQALSDLALQTDRLSPANASVPSGEQLRRTLAQVERLLREMRVRDLGAPRAAAEAELGEARRLLARVQEQLTSRWEGNQALATHTRDQLAQHEAGLMDLREALNRAVGTTREAEELNSSNQERLEEALHRKQELSRDNATLRATLQAASDTLGLVSKFLQDVDQAKEESERLAASLDGARTPLLEKMRAFFPASGKVDLVEAAEAHAWRLDQLAHNLSSIIRGVNQDRFIQRAIEAANAYSSILRAVQAAEGAAGQALQQASHAWATVVQQGLGPRARELRANSSGLGEAALREQRRLDRVRATLQDVDSQLRNAQAKKEQLAGQIQEVQAMLAMDTDETSKKIAHAKTVAAEAQDRAARVQSRLRDMQRNLERWQGQYGGLQSQDLGQVVLDAGRSVSTLEKTLPQLLAKLSLLENRGAHNASLALSASISRVRELIAEARGAASKVKVSMKFNGRSGVQLRAPRDLSDLAAYTALKFYLQSPNAASSEVTGDQFVLYMGSRQATGDYMGVALRDQKVHWVYRLGGAGPATLSIDEDIGEHCSPDETSKKIAHAKTVAAEAQDRAARVQSRLRDMQRNLERWQGQYGGLQSQDLGQVVLDAGRSVSTLEKTLPQLLAKLSLLENRGAHNASLALSASISRVRELIAEARGAASKVKVSMKFNGRSGVQLRAPRDLSDLAAYTALKFYLQSPNAASSEVTGDQFVLYMGSRQATGDYMGVALRDQKVHWVYRLGGAGPATLSIDEDIGEQFAAVSIDRTLQFGHMSVTVEKQMIHETKGDTVAPGAEGLLNLQPNDFVFYVGCYPSNFTPPEPLRFPCYRGCIEMDTLNEEVISLYNFEKTFLLNTAVDKPCARSKSTGDPWLTDGSYLDGSGFARISVERQMGTTKRFELEMRLVSSHGIIFFLQHEDQFLCLAVLEGNLLLFYDFGAGLEKAVPLQTPPPLTAASKAPLRHAVQIQVFLLGGSRKRVLVRVERATVFSKEQENVLELADAYYLGGVPPDQLPLSLRRLFPSGGSVRGCVKGIKALGKYVDLKRLNTTGISAGCTADLLVGRTMTFHGHGFLLLELSDVPPLGGNIYSGFGFRSTQDSGLLYRRSSPDGPCEVFLQQGHVTLRFVRTEVKSLKSLADGAPHYVTFYSNATGVWLYVDDQFQHMKAHQGPRPRPQPQPETLLLGGLPEPDTLRNLSGCISNVFVQRLLGPQRVLDLMQDVGSVNVSSGCALVPGTQMPAQVPRGLRAAAARKASRHSRQSTQDPACTLPRPLRTIRDAYQFGGPVSSFLEFAGLPAPPGDGSRLSMLVRPRTPRGLLLLAVPLTADSPSLALFLSHRHIVVQTEGPGPQLRVQSHQRLRAGQWHEVAVRWGKTQIQLQLDGVQALGQGEPGPQHRGAEGPRPHTLFVGGLPISSHRPKLPVAVSSSWFSGCVKGLELDGQPLRAPTRVVGVTPCLSGPVERGLFFTGSGGAITIDTLGATLPNVSLELEVRPQTATGLIFHLGRLHAPPYLRLQMLEKQVLLWADDGAGKFSTLVTLSKALCDGRWHQLAVTKSGNVLRLEVDSQSSQTVGPMPVISAYTLVPLHLGGLPEPTDTQPGRPTPTHPWSPVYLGCMRSLVVNWSPVTLPPSAGMQGAVGASGCPAT
ncbi:laminin subunit alpha-5, partial [Pteropus vampyrus]|uniref:Laminin subunit alpha-5 n=1 Tax=Pteropus vampyrus TaxID=132908 RepID=A0A6P6BKS1_PTEVA